MTSRYFGRRKFSALYAGQNIIVGIANGVAPPLFGAAHDWTGSYQMVLIAAAGLFAVTATAMLPLGPYQLLPQEQVAA